MLYIYTVDYIPMSSPVQSTHHIAVFNPGFCGEMSNFIQFPDLSQTWSKDSKNPDVSL